MAEKYLCNIQINTSWHSQVGSRNLYVRRKEKNHRRVKNSVNQMWIDVERQIVAVKTTNRNTRLTWARS